MSVCSSIHHVNLMYCEIPALNPYCSVQRRGGLPFAHLAHSQGFGQVNKSTPQGIDWQAKKGLSINQYQERYEQLNVVWFLPRVLSSQKS